MACFTAVVDRPENSLEDCQCQAFSLAPISPFSPGARHGPIPVRRCSTLPGSLIGLDPRCTASTGYAPRVLSGPPKRQKPRNLCAYQIVEIDRSGLFDRHGPSILTSRQLPCRDVEDHQVLACKYPIEQVDIADPEERYARAEHMAKMPRLDDVFDHAHLRYYITEAGRR